MDYDKHPDYSESDAEDAVRAIEETACKISNAMRIIESIGAEDGKYLSHSALLGIAEAIQEAIHEEKILKHSEDVLSELNYDAPDFYWPPYIQRIRERQKNERRSITTFLPSLAAAQGGSV